MVLIGLLLVAAVCLVLGLILPSAGCLVGALAATAVAAWVLWRGRDSLAPAQYAQRPPATSSTGADGDEAADAALAQPDYARRRADALGATAGSSATSGDADAATVVVGAVAVVAVAVVEEQPPAEAGSEVWVIDGRPHYHCAGCQALLGGAPEAVPHDQAVEDGFTPCPLCAALPGAAGATVATVWVADGWPHYHHSGCAVLALSGSPEAVPLEQAVADGFTPCPACRPTVVAEPEPAPAAASPLTEVWIVAGRPRYHLAGCMIIGEQGAVVRTLADARNEGFRPCSLCDPPA